MTSCVTAANFVKWRCEVTHLMGLLEVVMEITSIVYEVAQSMC